MLDDGGNLMPLEKQARIGQLVHVQPQHIQSTTSYKTDVQEWRSLAVAPDSKTQVALLTCSELMGPSSPGKPSQHSRSR